MISDNNDILGVNVGADDYPPAKLPERKTIRLRGYDYSENGVYFITICTENKKCIFGFINNGKMYLNAIGKIAKQCLIDIKKHFPFAVLDTYIIMPNHIHFIIVLHDKSKSAHMINDLRADNHSPLQPYVVSRNIGSIIRGFKIGVAKQIGRSVFQRNYYEHVIRENEYERIRNYINKNPSTWDADLYQKQIDGFNANIK